ncbi:hypothetical protein [Hymenobacter volaticus]|uniref:DUF1735 domain-containing protein n=1 Tax=Hymenobacter volaticus TaxID=2932254 RepID=A0ABY4G8H1_9BACT|nr:hypothetical protein [Hymenobacter volaticus]UOQ67197.1 hypothetical protein MUN86_04655 [Hymenobacter volaticus]
MKNIFFAVLAGISLASCSEISTDPAPTRATRTAQTVTVTYARTASTIAGDTTLQNPRLDVYVLTPTVNTDGTLSYPPITATSTPAFTTTDFSNPQPFSVATNLTVTENTPSTGIRLVLRTSNRPGRRNNSQRLTASIVINGASKATATHQGSNFSRTATATGGFFTTTLESNVAAYTF